MNFENDEKSVVRSLLLNRKAGFGTTVIAISLIAIILLVPSCTREVKPWEAGVLTVNIIGKKGVRDKVYPPGRYLVIPFIRSFDVYDTSVQKLVFEKESLGKVGKTYKGQKIEVRTSDGNTVWVDMTFLFRVIDEKAPKIRAEIGKGDLYVHKLLYSNFRETPRNEFGMITAEDFYNSEKRESMVAEIKNVLNDKLFESGIEIVDVLVNSYYFTKDFERRISQRKIADQEKFVNISAARANKELASLNEIEQQNKYLFETEKQRGIQESEVIFAKAERYKVEKQAEGNLAVKKAEAEGQKLLNEAYRKAGAGNVLGLKMAELLKGIDEIVIPVGGEDSWNPTELENLLKSWGISSR